MASKTHRNILLNRPTDWFFIFHTSIMISVPGSGKLQFVLKLVFVPIVRIVNRLLKGLNSSGITFDFPVEHSFEDPTGISPLHRRIGWVLSLAHLSDLIGELFNGSIILIFHTISITEVCRNLKGKIFWIPIARSCGSLHNRRIIKEGSLSRDQV